MWRAAPDPEVPGPVLLERLDRRAGTDQVPVAVSLVDAADGGPVLAPAAHGPAGIGPIDRVVTIENSAGQPLELAFSANVTP